MKLFKICLLLLVFTGIAHGGVNLKNGNFYTTFIDIVVPGEGADLEISRTYNSKATEKGWFGFGWGSTYETYLTVSADGSAIIHENGTGAMTRFTPKEAVDPKAAAKRIIEAMRKKSTITTKVAQDLEKRLVNNAEYRQMYARRFNVTSKLAVGTTLHSNDRGIQKLEKTKDGYTRVYNDGKKHFFNEDGKLVKITDKNGYKVVLDYKNGKLKSIKDSHAKQLFFAWYPDGKVKNIWKTGNKKTFYEYDGDNLKKSTDIESNVYTYSYDGNHNLLDIGYTDGKKMSIEYGKGKMSGLVTKVTEKNGDYTKYEYGANEKNPDMHYWTIVTKKDPISNKERSNHYEYEIKTRPDGSPYTYRILTKVNGLKTETIYSECCSMPLKITRGKHVTTFEYNAKGLLTKKASTKGDYVELKYHKEFNKVTRVVNNKGWTNYQYDKKGNLAKAINSKGKSVLLIYDRKGRITKMVDYNKKSQKKRSLSFEYNALGKPVEIAMSKVGKIHVAYDNYGEIKKVESKAGHKMALQVTEAFQSLLAIVKPAGVSFSL